ncbi:MAG: hypothetical protein Q9213_000849 [Squamulea squamosa]
MICGNCIAINSRFATYCPFCQVSSHPSPLPQGLHEPPAYSLSSLPHESFAQGFDAEQPPAYSASNDQQRVLDKGGQSGIEVADDVLHFLDPARDTISSLALRYAVPPNALRTKNNVYADHLLAARKTILIPGEFYKGGVSLSPQPIDGEEEEIRKSKVRRWMVTCKVSDYDIALLYLNQAKYDVDAAVEAYLADEQWERDHPIQTTSKRKPTRNRSRRTFDANDPYKCRALMTLGQWLDPPNEPYHPQHFKKWQPPGCMMHQYTRKDIRTCLNGQRIIYIGDSTTRQLFWATAKKLNATGADAYMREAGKHEDLSFADDVTVDFIWDPFLNSSRLRTEILSSLNDDIQEAADSTDTAGFITVGGGLWYARHFDLDSLDRYRDSLDYVAPLLSARKGGYWLYSPQSSEKGKTGHHVYMTPVQVPLYEVLSPLRASTITPTKIIPMNEYLFNLSTTKGIQVTWSHSLMTWEIGLAYEESGLHVVEDVAVQKVDVLLNLRCNAQMTYSHGYPFDKTCCSTYQTHHTWRSRFFLALVFIPTLIIGFRFHRTLFPRHPRDSYRHLEGRSSINAASTIDLFEAFAILTVVFTYCVLADRTQLFNKAQKYFMHQEFFGLCVIVLMLGLLSLRPEKRPAWWVERRAPDGPQGPEPSFLPRDQSDEWKGWMQFIILIYHYTGGSSILGIYQVIRILVASYLFLTGFGNTIFFYRKKNYSLSRCASVLVRYNLLSCVLAYVMDTDYLFYYFAPLVSFWYLIVYLTMRIDSARNTSTSFLFSKFVVSAVVVTILARVPILFDGIFLLLKYTCNIRWNVKEWQFRLQLDCYIVYVGMVVAIVYCKLSDFLHGQAIPQDRFAGALRSYWNKIHFVSVVVALTILPGFWCFTRRFSSKAEYNRWVPYVSQLPILSFIVLRNCNRHLRRFHSVIFAWLGRCSLETFTLQFHIWLAADTKGLLRSGVLGRKATHTEGRHYDLVLLTGLFLWLSWMTADATTTITNWIVDPNLKLVQDYKMTPLSVAEGGKLDAPDGMNNGRHSPGAFLRRLKAWHDLWMDSLKIRLASILLVMWILNMV